MSSQQTDSTGSEELPRHRRILQENGPAAGRISGINHLVMFTQDMNEGVRFYRDLLGLRVVRTMQFTPSAEGLRSMAHHSSGSAVTTALSGEAWPVPKTVRQVFFEMGNGELFSLYETPNVTRRPATAIASVLWPPIEADRVTHPTSHEKIDHIAFDVPTHDDVKWFREHLLANGVPVSDVVERRGADAAHKFISSIYMYDPSGNPLEISSLHAADAEWQTYDFSSWFFDEDPVPALVEAGENIANRPPLVPNWVRKPAE